MDTVQQSYKELQENFVSNHTGSTILENIAIIGPTPMVVFISCFVASFWSLKAKENIFLKRQSIYVYLFDYVTVIIPLILCCTLISEFIYVFVLFLLTVYTIIMGVTLKKHRINSIRKALLFSDDAQKPFITNFRSVISLLTAICILAVDFKIFPRRFAKTETFGFSLMDTGVGFFMISNAIVVKQYKVTCHLKLIYKYLLNILPLIILGVIRVYTVEQLDYQKHVSEYGVHWNFFFTLAAVKFISSCLLIAWPTKELNLSVLILIIHQLLLSCWLQDWIISPVARTNFFLANREGIISLPGYISLYLGGVFLGSKILPTTPKRSNISDVLRLFKTFIMLLVSTVALYPLFDISRRLVNVTYISWILTLSILFILLFMVADVSLNVIFRLDHVKPNYYIPSILHAVNYNGLIFFLLANLLTGTVNICVQTIHVKSSTALGIISLYMFVLCGAMSILYKFKIKLKFW